MRRFAIVAACLTAAALADAGDVRLRPGVALGVSAGQVRARARGSDGGGMYWPKNEWKLYGALRFLGAADVSRAVVSLEPAYTSVGAPHDYERGGDERLRGFRLDYIELPVTLGVRIGVRGHATMVLAAGGVYAYRVGVAPGSGYVRYVHGVPWYPLSPDDIGRLKRGDPGFRLSLTFEAASPRLAPIVGLRYTRGFRNLSPFPQQGELTTRRLEVFVGVMRGGRAKGSS